MLRILQRPLQVCRLEWARQRRDVILEVQQTSPASSGELLAGRGGAASGLGFRFGTRSRRTTTSPGSTVMRRFGAMRSIASGSAAAGWDQRRARACRRLPSLCHRRAGYCKQSVLNLALHSREGSGLERFGGGYRADSNPRTPVTTTRRRCSCCRPSFASAVPGCFGVNSLKNRSTAAACLV